VRGAFGFSKEKSLEYWTRTVNLGAVLAAAVIPLPFWSTIRLSPARKRFAVNALPVCATSHVKKFGTLAL
jgi:hypothetical protein